MSDIYAEFAALRAERKSMEAREKEMEPKVLEQMRKDGIGGTPTDHGYLVSVAGRITETISDSVKELRSFLKWRIGMEPVDVTVKLSNDEEPVTFVGCQVETNPSGAGHLMLKTKNDDYEENS